MIKRVITLTIFVTVTIYMLVMKNQDLNKNKTTNSWHNKKSLIVGTTPLSLPLDTAKVRSVSQYITLAQMGRSLIKVDRDAQYRGDLADSWKISEDYKQYSFNINESQKFSDGTQITKKDILCSFKRQIRINTAIHFDFSSIKDLKSNDSTIIVYLKSPNPRLIQQMAHPEFNILPSSECNKPIDKINFKVTSGPYFLKSSGSGKVTLKRNPYYEDFSAPNELQIIGASRTELAKKLKENKFDFCVGTGELSETDVKYLKEIHQIRSETPHIGFTYWLSINENNSELTNKTIRVSIAKKLYQNFNLSNKLKPFWTKAKQMYLPDGNGRLPQDKVNNFWNQENSSQEINFKLLVLLRKNFKLESEIIKALETSKLNYQITYYKNLKEFEQLTTKDPTKFHLIQINNDYSAIDLFENLKVTFNPVRPLIFQKSFSQEINNLMKIASENNDQDKMFSSYQRIEEIILTEGLMFPLAYNHMVFFLKSDINIDSWSDLFPEVSFWKIKPNN